MPEPVTRRLVAAQELTLSCVSPVALAPGGAFGDVVADRLRASPASDDDTLHEGLARYLSWWGR